MRRLMVLFVCPALACGGAGDGAPLGSQLPDQIAKRCSDAPLPSTVEAGDTWAEQQVANTTDLLDSLGFAAGMSRDSLSPWVAQTLCALGEPPLTNGDSVVRLVRMPSFPMYGRSYLVRIQAKGRATELSGRALALCMLDSLVANSPRVWDGQDTLIMIPDATRPGPIEFQSNRRVDRRLFNEAVAYLEQKEFWTSEGVPPVPDGALAFLEVQLGDRYRVLPLPTVLVADEALFHLIQQAGLLEATCPTSSSSSKVDHDWLVDDAWRIPRDSLSE